MAQLTLSEKLNEAAAVVCKQGLVKFPVTETAVAVLKHVVGDVEEELDLIRAFHEQPSQTMAQLVASSGFSEEKIERVAASLAKKGLAMNQPGSSGVVVYRLLPLYLVGLMEYSFMGKLTGSPEEKELGELFEKQLIELREYNQARYDELSPVFASFPAIDRTIPKTETVDGKAIRIMPVEKSMGVPEEFIVPSQSVEQIIKKADVIAVGHCFCRQRHEVLGQKCKTNAPTETCFSFGKSAQHTSAQGFSRIVTREEALKILREADQAGLIHKTFHPGSRESSPETGICNCCKDCCDTLRMWRDGTMPLINSTYYLSVIDADACTGCGVCEEGCPTDNIKVNQDGVAQRDESACLGCGTCARRCPESAISLKEGLRKVYIPPPRLRTAESR
jgi:ferredoxin